MGTNSYPDLEAHEEALAVYDDAVEQYYDMRDTGRRVDSFTTQIARALGKGGSSTFPVAEVLHEQRLCLD